MDDEYSMEPRGVVRQLDEDGLHDAARTEGPSGSDLVAQPRQIGL